MSVSQIHELFHVIRESLGWEEEPYRMYRPRGVNFEGYLNFLHQTTEEFSTHQEAIYHYLQHVAQPFRASPPPPFTLFSSP